MVNFMCQLDCRSPDTGKTWDFCVYMRLFQEEWLKWIKNWWIKWNRMKQVTPVWAGTTQSLESMKRTKGRRRAIHSLLEQTPILSCLQTLASKFSLAFRSRSELIPLTLWPQGLCTWTKAFHWCSGSSAYRVVAGACQSPKLCQPMLIINLLLYSPLISTHLF